MVRTNDGINARSREAVPGNLEEIAERSALVLAEAALCAGSRVEISSKSHILKGVIKSCTTQAGLGFLLEVRLSPESYWSQTGFVPQHLLTFRQPLLRLSA